MKQIQRSLDMIGKTYNNLKVLEVDHIAPNSIYYMLCECTKCKSKKVVAATHVKRGLTRSCGCLRAEKSRERQTKIEISEYDNIFKRWEDGESQAKISKDYGVTRQTIQLICKKVENERFKI